MVIAIIGESCVGKSTLAEELNKKLCGEIITGKDYLRLAKSESTAAAMFREKLSQALTGSHIIYVISEKEHLAFLPEGAIRILVTADLETIKERFKARMRGNLPAAVEAMLEKKYGLFDDIKCDLLYVSDRDDLDNICNEVAGLLS